MGVLELLPRGSTLTDASWRARHRLVTRMLWAHVPLLVALGVLGPMPATEAFLAPLLPVAFGVGARAVRSRRVQAELTSLGLVSTSFVAIELSGGQVTAHLHLLAVLVIVALYQQWTPLLWTVAVTVVHHAVLGLTQSERVFGMSGMSFASALLMVAAHAACVVLEVVGILMLWHFAEEAEREVERSAGAAEAAQRAVEADRAEAAEREAQAQRDRSAQLAGLTQRVAADVAAIRDAATAALGVVTTVSDQVAALSGAVSDIAHRAQQAAGTATTGQTTAEVAAEEVRRLEKAMAEIADVNSMIAQLAGQTNLLSLNATIEAARAGEMGRGFAVVASEVKALANETAESAGKVSAAIEAVVGETEAVARSFASTSSVVGEIHGLQLDIARSVEDQAATLADITRQLADASEAAAGILTGLEQLTESVRAGSA